MSRVAAGCQRRARVPSLALVVAALLAPASAGAQMAIGPRDRVVRAVILERLEYKIGSTPPSAAAYVATDFGVFRSLSGEGEWTAVGSSFANRDVTALAIWQRERPIEEPVVAHRTRVSYETLLYAVTARGELFRSRDRGASWASAGAVAAEGVGALAVDPARPEGLYAAADERVYRSADGGRTWTAARVAPPESGLSIASIAVDPSAPSIVFAAGRIACRDCSGRTRGALFRSADRGATWTRLAAAVEPPLLFGPETPPRLYASGPNGAVQSSDSGATWSPAGGRGLGPDAVLAIDPDWPGRVYGRVAGGAVARFDARCGADGSTLCFGDGRFRVRAARGSPDTPAELLPAIPKTGEVGSFWFERPSNVVLTIRIRDGRAVNGHFWVDYDSRSSLAFTLTVTDMATGASTNYFHPEGQRTSFTDHAAF